MDLIIEPDSVYTDTGKGDVSCFLSYDGTILDGAQINFSAYSQDVSEATITAASWSSPTSPTGLSSAVYYRPRDFTGDVDTLFAVHYGAEEDTLAWNFTTITILHP